MNQEDRELVFTLKSKVLRAYGFLDFFKVYEATKTFLIFIPFYQREGWEYANTLELIFDDKEISFYTTKNFLLVPGDTLGYRSDISTAIAMLISRHSSSIKDLREV